MSFMDVLQQYVNQPGGNAGAQASEHYGEAAENAPHDVVSEGLAHAFRSDQTPSFGEMVSHLFARSDGQQQAGLLNHLLSALGPGALSGVAGGALARLLGSGSSGITAEQAARVPPEQISALAAHAEKQNPAIVDTVSGFYAQHPGLVKTLGSAALGVALGSMARRMHH